MISGFAALCERYQIVADKRALLILCMMCSAIPRERYDRLTAAGRVLAVEADVLRRQLYEMRDADRALAAAADK